MSKRNGLWWAAGLVLGGLLLLIWNLDLLAPYEPWTQFVLAALLAIVGVGFFTGYLGVRNAWRFIPAWIMVSLVLMVLLSARPEPPAALIAALLFLGVAAAFVHIYLLDRVEHWWALLPAGFTLVIFFLVAATSLTSRITLLGALLFGGMGAVFFAVYLLTPGRHQWWSLIPGGVLFLFGLLLLTAQPEGEAGYLRWWPVLLIVAGLVVGWFSDSPTGFSLPWRSASRGATTSSSSVARNEPTATKSTAQAQSTSQSQSTTESTSAGRLGDYDHPAPGASVDLLQEGNDE